MSKSKEFLRSRFVRAVVATAALATATPHFEANGQSQEFRLNVPRQIEVPRGVDVASLVDCESEQGVKTSKAVVAFNKDTQVYIGDRSNPSNPTAALSYDEAGVRVTEAPKEGKMGPSTILTPPGEQPQYLKNGEAYITSGERSLSVVDKTVKINGVEVRPDARVAHIDVFCNPQKWNEIIDPPIADNNLNTFFQWSKTWGQIIRTFFTVTASDLTQSVLTKCQTGQAIRIQRYAPHDHPLSVSGCISSHHSATFVDQRHTEGGSTRRRRPWK
jgi:hypothetical protein